MKPEIKTIDVIASICSQAVKSVFELNGSKEIWYSPTIQKIPKVSLKPEIGCFVQFYGDYNGLIVMNFSEGAAMVLYQNYLTSMGLPAEEMAKNYTSSEVPDTIGEMVNQAMGQIMRMVEESFELTSLCGQPKALALNNAIMLTIDSDYGDNRRIVFSVDNQKFYMELAFESTEFIPMKKVPATVQNKDPMSY